MFPGFGTMNGSDEPGPGIARRSLTSWVYAGYQLVRHGYRVNDLAAQFDAKPAEIKALFSNTLESSRGNELKKRMLAAGLSL